MDKEYTATDLQRQTFEALKAAKSLGEIHVRHKTLGDFKIIPDQETAPRKEVKLGTMKGRMELQEGAFDTWSEELVDMFGLND